MTNPTQIETFNVPEHILQGLEFSKIWEMKPESRSQVWHNEKKIDAHRFYRTYGDTPPFEFGAKSYMFSSEKDHEFPPIPSEFSDLLTFLNLRNNAEYNNVVVNWYENGDDYTPRHQDCLTGLNMDAGICIVNIVDTGPGNRIFALSPGSGEPFIYIECEHGTGMLFNGDSMKKRHGIPKSDKPVSRRISISFRSYCL